MINIYNLNHLKYDSVSHKTFLYLEYGEVLESDKKPWQILDDFCKYHGSTLKGRMESAKEVLHILQKPPVLVCLYMDCIFFPTSSYKSNDCIWIQARLVQSIKAQTSSSCEITFKDGSCILVPIGYRAMQRQMSRCQQYYDTITVPMKLEQVKEMIQGERYE
ncbi:MAG: competence protein ComK [Erysipelotrichaceae bacterium]|nr:competence protein ComK [Erysipelotrichaceae bacterium]